jgi:urease accessory protein
VNGVLDLRFTRRGDRSVLTHLYRKAPLLVQQALYWDEHLPGLPCVYVITTSGCVLQGDRLDLSIAVGPEAMAHVTTQSATKIHEMEANFAAQTQRVILDKKSYLEFLPGPAIPHRHSRFITHTHATVADDATLLYAEILQPGRKYHGQGEIFEYDLFSSSLTAARPSGSPLFTEKLIAEPWRHPVRQTGVMGKFDVFANVTLITPSWHRARIIDQIVNGFVPAVQCVAGASLLPHDAGLVYKVLGMDVEPVKAMVRAFWRTVRQEVAGAPIPPARPWGPPLLPAEAVGRARVLQEHAGKLDARGDAELAESHAKVIGDGVRADVHTLGDLHVVESLRDPAGHSLLGARQAVPPADRPIGWRHPVPAANAELAQPLPDARLITIGTYSAVPTRRFPQMMDGPIPVGPRGVQDTEVFGGRGPGPRVGVTRGGLRQAVCVTSGQALAVRCRRGQYREPRLVVRESLGSAAYPRGQLGMAGGQCDTGQPGRQRGVTKQQPGPDLQIGAKMPDVAERGGRAVAGLSDLSLGKTGSRACVDAGEPRTGGGA